MGKVILDEMQLKKRNKIGNDAFLMLMYLLLLDMALYGLGFRWLQYPVNVMIILQATAIIYIVRIILANAFVGPSRKSDRPILKTGIIIVFSASLAALGVVILKNKSLDIQLPILNDGLMLFTASAVGIAIAIITGIIRWKQNRDEKE